MDQHIDHFIYATNDLQRGIAEIAGLLGAAVHPGGSHPGFGTRNAIVPLGQRCYLEVIGPDPEQPEFEGERIFGVGDLDRPCLAHWCVRRDGLAGFGEKLRAQGIAFGETLPMSRLTAEGEHLHWELAFPTSFGSAHPLPFFIDWGASPHPAAAFPQEATLLDFRVTHPDAAQVNATLTAMSIEPCASSGPEFSLTAVISAPNGEVTLT